MKILENFEWNDESVIDFINWFLELHKLPFRYKLENKDILESFMKGDDFSVWHYESNLGKNIFR